MQCLNITSTGSISIVTINRPKYLNALNHDVLDDLQVVLQQAYQNENVRGIIITGEGDKAFIAGADIKELTALNKVQAFELARKGQSLFSKIEYSPVPIIAAINGFALGGGCELAMACHIRIAVKSAKFGQPEVNLGIIPGYGGTQRLAQLVGRGKAMELILTGDLIGADEAHKIGLVNHVVADNAELIAFSQALLNKIISKAPVAIKLAIKSINAGYDFEKAGYEAEAENFAACTDTHDFKEGTTAFIEKRKPSFTGN